MHLKVLFTNDPYFAFFLRWCAAYTVLGQILVFLQYSGGAQPIVIAHVVGWCAGCSVANGVVYRLYRKRVSLPGVVCRL